MAQLPQIQSRPITPVFDGRLDAVGALTLEDGAGLLLEDDSGLLTLEDAS